MDTKAKVAKALKELLAEKPLRKITVYDIMGRSHMTRQSFYYHFQDIYQVFEWICDQELIRKVESTSHAFFEDWLEDVIVTIDEDKNFYRRVLEGVEWHKIEQRLFPFVERAVRQMVDAYFPAGTSLSYDPEGHDFVVDFITSSVIHYLFKYVVCRKNISKAVLMKQVGYLMSGFRHMNPIYSIPGNIQSPGHIVKTAGGTQ